MREEQLIGADRCQNHRAVVIQAPVPDAVIKIEQMLELGMKRFDGGFASLIKPTTSNRLQEGSAFIPCSSVPLAFGRLSAERLTCPGGTPAPHFGAEESAS